MNRFLTIILMLLLSLFSGCASPPFIVGQTGEPISSEAVEIYYLTRPACNFETIAHIQMQGWYFTLDSLLKNMRRQAAQVGASGLYVLQTQQLEMKDYTGTAKAIRCLPA